MKHAACPALWKEWGEGRGVDRAVRLGAAPAVPQAAWPGADASAPHRLGQAACLPAAAGTCSGPGEHCPQMHPMHTPAFSDGQGATRASVRAVHLRFHLSLAHSGSPHRVGVGMETQGGRVTWGWSRSYLDAFSEPLAWSSPNPKDCTPVAQHPKLSSQETSEKVGETVSSFSPSVVVLFRASLRPQHPCSRPPQAQPRLRLCPQPSASTDRRAQEGGGGQPGRGAWEDFGGSQPGRP